MAPRLSRASADSKISTSKASHTARTSHTVHLHFMQGTLNKRLSHWGAARRSAAPSESIPAKQNTHWTGTVDQFQAATPATAQIHRRRRVFIGRQKHRRAGKSWIPGHVMCSLLPARQERRQETAYVPLGRGWGCSNYQGPQIGYFRGVKA
jgi:hypothetical protein